MRNATGVDCLDAVIACPLAPGATADQTVESTETVTTQPDGTTSTTIACDVPVNGQAVAHVTAADVEQWVVRQLPIGAIGTPQARSLVNSKTVLWLDVPAHKEWGPLTIVEAGVRIRATLTSVHWQFGDATTDSSADPGRKYVPAEPCDARCDAYYGHIYTGRTGPVTINAQAYWKAEFSVNGGPFAPLPAAVPANQAPGLTVTLVQARSQLIPGS